MPLFGWTLQISLGSVFDRRSFQVSQRWSDSFNQCPPSFNRLVIVDQGLCPQHRVSISRKQGNNARPSVIPQQTFSWRLINYSGKFRPVSIKQLKPLLGFVCGNFNWLAAWKLSSSLSISRSLACRDVPINGRLNNIYGSLLDNPSFFLQWYLSIKLYLILQYNL